MVTIAKKDKETAIQRIMDGLKCDRAEAEQVYEYDCKVDAGEKTEHDLTAAQQKIAQKFAHAGTRKTPTAYKFTQRQRKPNATKAGIIAEIAEFLEKNSQFSVENLQVTNKERQISFEIGGEKYEFTLVQKRKPKK